MSVLMTGDPDLPAQIYDPWVKSVANGSTIAVLSPQKPMKFGKGEATYFDTDEAEYVGEGAVKGDSEYYKSSQTFSPFKFHKTVRWSDEVMWADEDYQLGVIDEILSKIQPALSRALDFGVIHGLNPKNATAVPLMSNNLAAVTNVVAIDDASPVAALDAADALVLGNGNTPSGLALDPSYAIDFATVRDDYGRKVYPDLAYTTSASSLEGHTTSVSGTVSGSALKYGKDPDTDKPNRYSSGIGGIVGDFTAVYWGIQKQVGLEVIQYGDPDGNGDLQRFNQVAFRAEVVYGWGIADPDAFCLLTNSSGS